MKKLVSAIILCMQFIFITSNTFASADIYGDVDHNGTVNAQDAAYTLNHVLNSSFMIDKILADADANGEITAADSAMIMQKALVSTYKFTKETENPFVNSTELDVSKLPYGVYTKNFDVGNITVLASKDSPVYVKDICIYTESTGEKTYEKNIVMTKGSSLAYSTSGDLYSFSIGFLFITDSDYALETSAPCNENNESLEHTGSYSEKDEYYEHRWDSWQLFSATGYWKNSSDKPVLIRSAKLLKIR